MIINKLEKKLRSEGSELAKVRDEFVAERGHLHIAIKQDEERLRELAGGTLPFALCPSLLRQFGKSLTAASDRMTPMARKRVSAGMSSVLKLFVSGALSGSEAIDRRARKKTAEVLARELRAALTSFESRKESEPLPFAEAEQVLGEVCRELNRYEEAEDLMFDALARARGIFASAE